MERHTQTPTPWRVGDAGNTIFGPPNGNPSPETVATLVGPMERKRANARLILAAPEMLDLLQRVADNDANFKLDQPDLWAEHQDKIEEDARALLAKLKA